MNTSQILPDWQKVMGEPSESALGLLTAMYSIGSIASLPVVPYLSDHFGRKIPIIVGCIIMVIAAAIQVCADQSVARETFTDTFSYDRPLLKDVHNTKVLVSSWVSATLWPSSLVHYFLPRLLTRNIAAGLRPCTTACGISERSSADG